MVKDMRGNEINEGDIVKVYTLIGFDYYKNGMSALVGKGKIYSLSSIHGQPDKPMVWVCGITSCYHPEAVRLCFKKEQCDD